MSHPSRGRNLAEWADLVGASLPDSVDERGDDDEGAGTPANGPRERATLRQRSWTDFAADPERNE
ncbi:MAG: hypothetical protein ABEK02_09400 [Haloquadratum sp.]